MTDIRCVLNRYISGLLDIYKDALKAVVLYGSYARGDYTPESDIDIMILVDLDDSGISQKRHALSDLTYDFNEQHKTEIMPIVKNLDHFNQWVRSYPFYNNIAKEGISLYAA